jgi:glycosyltransferase involved in cell wall biosynthesis
LIVGIDARVAISRGRGWGRYASELVLALAATRSVELRVLLPRGAGAEALAARVGADPGVRTACVEFDAASPDRYWEAAGDVTIEGVLGPVDLVHSPTRFVLPTTVPALVATVHDVAPLSNPPFKPEYREATVRAIRFIRERRVQVVAVSAFTLDELRARAGLDVTGAVVVHPGVSSVFLNAPLDRNPTARAHVLYVGGAGPNKNLERLIDAVERLRQDHPAELVIAGDRRWDEADLRRLLAGRPSGWIRLTGYVDDEELARLYRKALVSAAPSLHEGFGLPLVEAMASGTPVACSRIPVFEEMAHDAAAYFDPSSVDDIAATLRRLLGDAPLRAALSARGRARAAALTWAETARKTLDVYRRVATRPRVE